MEFSYADTRTLFSTISDLYKKGSNLEAEQKLLELREAFLEFREESLQIKTELQEMKEAQSLKDKLTFEEPFYYLIEGDDKDGPFCQRCYDVDKLHVRLSVTPSVFGSHQCKQCKENYGQPGFTSQI